MEPLVEALKIMKNEFVIDAEYINNEIISLNGWIEENEPIKKTIQPRQKLEKYAR